MCSVKNYSSTNDDMIVNDKENNGRTIIFNNDALGVHVHPRWRYESLIDYSDSRRCYEKERGDVLV